MKSKLIVSVIGLGLAVVLASAMLGGCGALSTTKHTYYYYPDWTSDGRIVCIKANTSTTSGSGPTPSVDTDSEYFITTMDANGSNEVSFKKIENVAHIAASSLGNYYAYSCWDPSSNYLIRVVDKTGNNIALINLTSEVYDLAWAPDEKDLAYTKSGVESIFVYNLATGQVKEIPSIDASSLAWRFNSRIVFFNWVSHRSYLSFIDKDGLGLVTTTLSSEVGSYPQYTTDGQYVVTVKDTEYEKVDPSLGVVVANIPHAANSTLFKIKISPDATKIIANSINGTQIWLANYDWSDLQQLR